MKTVRGEEGERDQELAEGDGRGEEKAGWKSEEERVSWRGEKKRGAHLSRAELRP